MSKRNLLKHIIAVGGTKSEQDILFDFLDASEEEIPIMLEELVNDDFLKVEYDFGQKIYKVSTERIEVSYSAVNMFRQCELKYYFAKVAKIQKPFGFPLYTGIVIHDALEKYKKGRLLEVLGKSDETQITSKELEALIYHMWRVQEERMSPEMLDGSRFENEVEITRRLFVNYVHMHGDDFDPIEIEKWYDVPVINPYNDEPKNWHLRGKIDFELVKGKKIGDYKTSSGKKTQDWVDFETQPGFYALLLGVKNLEFVYEILNKKAKTPKAMFQRLTTYVDEQKVFQAYRMIEDFVNRALTGNCAWLPSRGEHCNYMCSYKEECIRW